MRKLASIRKIDEVKVHPNADALELAVIGGWQCVVKKGEFISGDLCVYFEVDSVLPVRPEYEFLRKSCYRSVDWLPNGEGFRLKTIKLRGQLSQGLVMPLNLFPEAINEFHKTGLFDAEVGLFPFDVTEVMSVVKWDPPENAQLGGQPKGTFPHFIPKTDQERAQNIMREILSANQSGDTFEVSIKLDGSSCTMFYYDGEVGVCSRNQELKINEENAGNTFVRMINDTGMAEFLKSHGRNIAIQGELMGPGIQGNRENFGEHKFFIYDIYDIDKQDYLLPSEREEFYDCVLMPAAVQVYHVPVVNQSVTVPGTIEELLQEANGWSVVNPIREGLVYKHCNGGFSFKIISNEFLMGED